MKKHSEIQHQCTHNKLLNSKMQLRLFIIFSVYLFLAGCSDDAPRDKIHSFIYSTFYMKVIDQNGQPVSGVETEVTHGGRAFVYGSNSSGKTKYISDSNGIISIKVDSRQISIRKISKRGYSINLLKILFEYGCRQPRSYNCANQGELTNLDFKKFSKKSPFIISAWKINESELSAECMNGEIRTFLNTDDRAYGVDLLKPVNEAMVEGASERPIQIKFYRENIAQLPSNGNILRQIFKLDWNYSVTMTNGGLIEMKPESVYKKIPPLSGYSESWQLNNDSFRVRTNEYGGSSYEDDRHFYIKLNDETYARLSIRFKPVGWSRDDHQKGAITLDYSVNIDGSRIVRGIDGINSHHRQVKRDSGSCIDFVRLTERF